MLKTWVRTVASTSGSRPRFAHFSKNAYATQVPDDARRLIRQFAAVRAVPTRPFSYLKGCKTY